MALRRARQNALPNVDVAIVHEISRSPAGKILRRLVVEKFNLLHATREMLSAIVFPVRLSLLTVLLAPA
jgi:acyl-CoA synthetase (AMP-forming)/AMP-acid ligase II